MIKGAPVSKGVKIFLQKITICWLGDGFETLRAINKEKELRKASVIRNIIDEDDKQHGPKYTPLWNTRYITLLVEH